ncbi:MAG: ATP-binding cassette domain-containing protein, partial [Pseudomonadota bacterium]|nr:ATP-binding cassette domain-containing protein [Pseudomonadota bacterium]
MGILEVKNVNKRFGGLQALGDVNLSVAENTVHAIIGPNGAGKSTLFNLVSALFAPTRGEVRLNGRVISGLKPDAVNRLGLSRSFQVSNIFGALSVHENVRCGVLRSLGIGYSFWRPVGRIREVAEATDRVLRETGLSDKAGLVAG